MAREYYGTSKYKPSDVEGIASDLANNLKQRFDLTVRPAQAAWMNNGPLGLVASGLTDRANAMRVAEPDIVSQIKAFINGSRAYQDPNTHEFVPYDPNAISIAEMPHGHPLRNFALALREISSEQAPRGFGGTRRGWIDPGGESYMIEPMEHAISVQQALKRLSKTEQAKIRMSKTPSTNIKMLLQKMLDEGFIRFYDDGTVHMGAMPTSQSLAEFYGQVARKAKQEGTFPTYSYDMESTGRPPIGGAIDSIHELKKIAGDYYQGDLANRVAAKPENPNVLQNLRGGEPEVRTWLPRLKEIWGAQADEMARADVSVLPKVNRLLQERGVPPMNEAEIGEAYIQQIAMMANTKEIADAIMWKRQNPNPGDAPSLSSSPDVPIRELGFTTQELPGLPVLSADMRTNGAARRNFADVIDRMLAKRGEEPLSPITQGKGQYFNLSRKITSPVFDDLLDFFRKDRKARGK